VKTSLGKKAEEDRTPKLSRIFTQHQLCLVMAEAHASVCLCVCLSLCVDVTRLCQNDIS